MGRPEILQRVRAERIPQGPDDERVAKVFDDAKAGKPVRLFKSHRDGIADGDQRRDFIYVDDAVAVVRWLIDTPSVNGIFNVGTGKAGSFRDLIGAMFKALGRPANIEYIDMPEAIRGQYQYFTQGKCRKSAPRRLQRRLHAARDSGRPIRHRLSRPRRSLSLSRDLYERMFDFDKHLAGARRADRALHRRSDARRFRLWRRHAHFAGSADAGDRGQAQRSDDRRRRQCRAQSVALGARCLFVGVVGDDDAGRALPRRWRRIRDRIPSGGRSARPTTRKLRFVSEHHSTHLLRADWEMAAPVDAPAEDALISHALKALPRAGAVVLSDYAKGVLTPRLIRAVIDAANNSKSRSSSIPRAATTGSIAARRSSRRTARNSPTPPVAGADRRRARRRPRRSRPRARRARRCW